MALQYIPWGDFMHWAEQVSLLQRIHDKDTRGLRFVAWLQERLDVLCSKKALQMTPAGVADA